MSPEVVAGSFFARANWILRGATDMSRIDVLRGGITGCKKMASVCEAYGVKCEIHMSGFANLQTLGQQAKTHVNITRDVWSLPAWIVTLLRLI